MTRKRFVALVAAILFAAHAQSACADTVRLLVGYPAGSSADIVARILADALKNDFPATSFVVENKPGADGAIAAREALNSTPDGTMFLLLNNGALGSVFETLSYDPLAFSPVAYLGDFEPPWIVVRDSSPWKSVDDLFAHAKKHPEALNFASGNNIGDRCFARLVGRGLDIVRVKYPGEPRAFPDLLAGRVDAMCSIRTASLPHVKSGTLRVLLSHSAASALAMPRPLFGLAGPPGLSPAVASRMAHAVQRILRNEEIAKKLRPLGFEPRPGNQTQLESIMRQEVVDIAEERRALDARAKTAK